MLPEWICKGNLVLQGLAATPQTSEQLQDVAGDTQPLLSLPRSQPHAGAEHVLHTRVDTASPLRLLHTQSLLLSPSSCKMRSVAERYGCHKAAQLAAILGSPVRPVRKLLGSFLVGKQI